MSKAYVYDIVLICDQHQLNYIIYNTKQCANKLQLEIADKT